ncbi:(d)CMP kinase [Furfurilactobacillus siliginis]|uniref:Cytidylate kinase n=1 Tax=Furfurilactobacillus siliginis TaxID=348151 RepID=A0A0R2LEP4_9LACO|nr:(d)CMP kinase [Furfurilactobacillus siliginis]KRN97021.1 cytidylate kinase [Furfurilactobacillus siliginis]GEK27781.1 cytidylate kinase [Furfurilactobacillus siliginis]
MSDSVISGIQVAIDGPASAGKSTVAKLVAAKYGYVYLDTGAMYRAITWAAMDAKVALDDEAAVMVVVEKTPIHFAPGTPDQLVFAGDQDVTRVIREETVTNNVSTVAALPAVRAALTAQMQTIAAAGGIVMDGRDIGTTVLPNAQVKIFLEASVAERAQRRFKENQAKGIDVSLATLEQEIAARDYKDSHRATSPLTQATDAELVDTTSLTIEEVVNKIADAIDKYINLQA